MTGDVPPSMSGACGCSLEGHMYIFGGCDDNGQTNMVRLITDALFNQLKRLLYGCGHSDSLLY